MHISVVQRLNCVTFGKESSTKLVESFIVILYCLLRIDSNSCISEHNLVQFMS